MAFLPPYIMAVTLNDVNAVEFWEADDGTGDPWVGAPYRWSISLLVSPQLHSCHLTPTPFQYDGNDVAVGDWIADLTLGYAVRVVEIITPGFDTVECIVEDVDRFNTFCDTSQSGNGIGAGQGFVFRLGDDGLPILGPMTSNSGNLTLNYAWQLDQISRFRYRNYLRSHYPVTQPGHAFVEGDLLRMTPDGYIKATASDAVGHVVGTVSAIGIPSVDWFNYRPVGRVVENLPALPGVAGDLVYLDDTGALTASKPSAWARPVYIRLETETKGIVLDRGVETENKNGYSSQIYVVDDMAGRAALTGINPGDQALVRSMGNGEWAHFIYELNGGWTLLVTQDASNVDTGTKQVILTFDSTTPGTIWTISPGRRVEEVTVQVIEAFDGGATITVGDDEDNARLMGSDQSDLSIASDYMTSPAHLYTDNVDTEIKYYLNANSATTGRALVTVSYS